MRNMTSRGGFTLLAQGIVLMSVCMNYMSLGEILMDMIVRHAYFQIRILARSMQLGLMAHRAQRPRLGARKDEKQDCQERRKKRLMHKTIVAEICYSLT